MNKSIVIITSIYYPTKAVEDFSNTYRTIVVADKKTPSNWFSKNATFMSCSEQEERFPSLSSAIPWNHYSRKMLGYAAAINDETDIIIDTDDDNVPMKNFGFPSQIGNFDQVSSEKKWINIYKVFSDSCNLWPRGFPLKYIKDRSELLINNSQGSKVGIWQGLADGDPDVDAIYRMVCGDFVKFRDRDPIVISPGNWCPFNSQNTAYFADFFALLYLPVSVTFRFTDILRSFVAQPILWAHGASLGFLTATVFQDRNPHDFMSDFSQEMPMYLDTERIVEVIEANTSSSLSIMDNLMNVYSALVRGGYCKEYELTALNEWLKAIS